MAAFTQSERVMSVETRLGPDVLLLKGMTGTEQLGVPFEFELDLISENFEIAAEDMLGQPVTVWLRLLDGSRRWFHGICNRFSDTGHQDRFCRYRATLVPWLWLLTRTSDCRIFQEMKAPDIIKQVFRDAGFTDFEDALSGNYREWDYCVQYRETHFNFVSRLMQHEGIYYYFKHQEGRHILVLSDSYGAHESFPGHARIPYHVPGNIAVREQDYVFDWSVSAAIRSGAFAHNDYDFAKPRNRLLTQTANPRAHSHADMEIYDYPGAYVENTDGDTYARIRMEELQADYEISRGQGFSRGIAVGSLFNLTDHPWSARNREYLVISTVHELNSNEFVSTADAPDTPIYRSSFAVMDAKQTYRPPRTVPKPMIHGLQTAVVVGKSGEEIWTDKYGRIKVQFHWDRYGNKDEHSSCWIRVAQPWAGKNWGAVAIPRIDQEVVISFLEGDPDRPLVTGSVYNADQMPPYGLPSNQTQSGVKTRSSKGGGASDFNELRFEDKKGSEDVYFHAQKDFHRVVEKNDDLKVMKNQTIEIKKDRTEIVSEGNEKTTIEKGNRTEELGMGDETLTLKMGNRKVELDMGNDDLTLKMGDQTTKLNLGKSSTDAMRSIELKVGQSSIKVDQTGVTIKGMMITIKGQVKVDVKGVMTTVKGDGMLTLKGGLTKIN